MQAAENITSLLTDELLQAPGMAQCCESYRAVELHVLLRFGKWSQILSRSAPENSTVRGGVVSACVGVYMCVYQSVVMTGHVSSLWVMRMCLVAAAVLHHLHTPLR